MASYSGRHASKWRSSQSESLRTWFAAVRCRFVTLRLPSERTGNDMINCKEADIICGAPRPTSGTVAVAAKTDKCDAGANGRARDRAVNCERVSNVR